MKQYIDPCNCGSGHLGFPLFDGYGIFMCYTCDECHDKKVKKFRPDIFEAYETDEQIDEDY